MFYSSAYFLHCRPRTVHNRNITLVHYLAIFLLKIITIKTMKENYQNLFYLHYAVHTFCNIDHYDYADVEYKFWRWRPINFRC